MQIVLICVGKLKEKYWREALAEYTKRLSGYATFSVVEVPDEAAPDNLSPSQQETLVKLEAERIQKHLRDRDGVVALDISGKQLSSEAWSAKFSELEQLAFGRIVFVVGGSYGLSQDILRRAVFRWSFGPITLPHQLARIVLAEQLYRGMRIARREPYHK